MPGRRTREPGECGHHLDLGGHTIVDIGNPAGAVSTSLTTLTNTGIAGGSACFPVLTGEYPTCHDHPVVYENGKLRSFNAPNGRDNASITGINDLGVASVQTWNGEFYEPNGGWPYSGAFTANSVSWRELDNSKGKPYWGWASADDGTGDIGGGVDQIPLEDAQPTMWRSGGTRRDAFDTQGYRLRGSGADGSPGRRRRVSRRCGRVSSRCGWPTARPSACTVRPMVRSMRWRPWHSLTLIPISCTWPARSITRTSRPRERSGLSAGGMPGMPAVMFVGLLQPLRGDNECYALTVNGDGAVVGLSVNHDSQVGHAVLYWGGKTTNLTALLPTQVQPEAGVGTAINARGQILLSITQPYAGGAEPPAGPYLLTPTGGG